MWTALLHQPLPEGHSSWMGCTSERISVVYNALTSRFDGSISKDEARQRVGLPGTLVLTVARLYKWKNIDVLIKLVPDLPLESKLVIVGDGPEEEYLKRLAAEVGVADRVVFVGRVPQAQVAIPARSRCLCPQHRYEGLSHTILECMDVGIPVVATAVGGNMELIGRRIQRLPRACRRPQADSLGRPKLLYDRNVRDAFVQRSKEKVKDASWDRLVDTTVGILDQVAKGVRE